MTLEESSDETLHVIATLYAINVCDICYNAHENRRLQLVLNLYNIELVLQ